MPWGTGAAPVQSVYEPTATLMPTDGTITQLVWGRSKGLTAGAGGGGGTAGTGGGGGGFGRSVATATGGGAGGGMGGRGVHGRPDPGGGCVPARGAAGRAPRPPYRRLVEISVAP